VIRRENDWVRPGFRDADHAGVCAILVGSTECAGNKLSRRISPTGEDASEPYSVYSLGLVPFPDFEISDGVLALDGLFKL
jgi:hypothetical protein